MNVPKGNAVALQALFYKTFSLFIQQDDQFNFFFRLLLQQYKEEPQSFMHFNKEDVLRLGRMQMYYKMGIYSLFDTENFKGIPLKQTIAIENKTADILSGYVFELIKQGNAEKAAKLQLQELQKESMERDLG